MLVGSSTPLVDSRVEELVLWTQNLTLLEGEGLRIQTIVPALRLRQVVSEQDLSFQSRVFQNDKRQVSFCSFFYFWDL